LVVLSLITRNSCSKLKHTPITLVDVLNSVLQIPFKSLILVDDSIDETPEVIANWCSANNKEVLIYKGAGNRAIARQLSISKFVSNFSEEWLMFVDDDVIVNPGWWEEASSYVKESDVGLIWGLNYDGYKERIMWLKLLGVNYVNYLIREFYRRGGTHDTMIRRYVLKNLQIPQDLHVFEDWYILNHVLKRGFKVKIVKAGVTHYNPWLLPAMGDIRLMAHLARKYGVEGPSAVRLAKSLAGLPLNLYVGVKGFGIKNGLSRGVRRWLTKVAYRVLLYQS